MGYYAHSTENDVRISKDNITELVAVYNDEARNVGRPLDIYEIFTQEGFHIEERDGGSEDMMFWYEHDRYCADDILRFLSFIAPYVDAGSYIAFQGEDDDTWAYYFNGNGVEKYYGITVFPLMPGCHGRVVLRDSFSVEVNMERIFGKDLVHKLPHDLYSRIEDKVTQGCTAMEAISQSLFDIITAKSPEESFMSQDALFAICGGGS